MAALAALASACGSQAPRRRAPGENAEFECRGRRAEYMVVGGFVAPEAGISMICDNDRPMLTVWRVDQGQSRSERDHALSAGQFDDTWEKIDSTGWRYLDKECPGSTAQKKVKKGRAPDPLYTIDVGDAQVSASFTCGAKELPFPYNQMVNELDLLAAGFAQAGDTDN
ncbi:MAG TPA: hypothetical protein VFU21_04245 [Kofleriaceae bacterium]|nr:hypothetical protein [Kofleriaceae bacterium]